jgi:hypothetical protein
MYSGTKPGNAEGIVEPRVERHGADVVAVVERNGPAILHRAHRAHVRDDTGRGARHVPGGLILRAHCVAARSSVDARAARSPPAYRAPGLIGDDVGDDAALHHLGSTSAALPTGRPRGPAWQPAPRASSQEPRRGRGHLVAVARLDTLVDARRVHLHAEDSRAVHRGGQRLRTAHAAESGREHETTGERAAEVLAPPPRRRSRTSPARCLASRCRSTSPPSSGRTSSGPSLELAEMAHVANRPTRLLFAMQHAWSMAVGAEHRDRLAALHEQRFVVLERFERAHDGIERGPVSAALPVPP